MAQAFDPRGPLPAILDRLDKVKSHGDYWTARCPAHQDRDPSLSISEGNDGRVLLKCHAGCTTEAIVSAIGLTEADLFPPRQNGTLTEAAVYRYQDELGAHVYDVVRFEPKTFRQRRPDGTWGLGDTRRVLYRLPELVAATALGNTIYVVEGEKDADAIARAGAAATCNPMGAGKWRDEYANDLSGARQVVVVADNDDVGKEHAATVARSLEQRNIPFRIVLPAAGKDAADHLAAGYTLEQLVPLITSTATATVRIVTLDEFVAVTEDVTDPLIGTPDDALLAADGTLLMYGDGGAGKTTLSIDALAHLASGTPWLSISVPRALRIMLIENEGPRGPFRQRLAAKIASWEGQPFSSNVTVLEEPWTRFTLTDQIYRHELADAIGTHNTDLVIVGPLASLGAKGTGTPDEINEFDNHIKDLRGRADRPFALWIVHHENKAGDVSGAWERYPDSLVHVQAQGNGRTRVHWRKVRWSSALHQTSSNLVWVPGSSFTIEEKPERDLRSELLNALADGEWHLKGKLAQELKLRAEKLGKLVAQLEVEDDPPVESISPMPGSSTHNSIGIRLRSSHPSGRAGKAGLPDPVKTPLFPPARPVKEGQEGEERATRGTAVPTTPEEPPEIEPLAALLDDDVPW